MTLLNINLRLNHKGQEDLIQQAARTHAGMAHFAGSGPIGRTCVFWLQTKMWYTSGPRPAKCTRFFQLTHKWGETIPHDAGACKHFAEADKPQPLAKRKASVFDRG